MRKGIWTIISNEALTEKVFRMRLQGDTTGIEPGQFVEIEVPGQYLRRPISVCDAADGQLTMVYKVVGVGTDKMSRMEAGETLSILSPLGHGYDLQAADGTPLLLGGGVGVPPLYYLAKQLQGKCRVVLGFNTANEVFYEQEFRELGCEVTVVTADGSYGQQGFVTSVIDPQEKPYYYACGPLPMLKAILAQYGTNGQMSMEERMGCGFGICVGCTIRTRSGHRRVCKDGPVFKAEELML